MTPDLLCKQQLAAAYQIMALQHMDDLTYAHLSARSPQGNSYYIYPLGLLFSEVTASCLLEVNFDGQVISDHAQNYNQTGYTIHGSIYQHKPDINAIFHLHTYAGVAVSAMKSGLLPVSQFALHFYDNIGYHAYDALALDPNHHGQMMSNDLKSYPAMILRNHGTIACGTTIQEAYFYATYLEKACKVQCALSGTSDVHIPSPDTCFQARRDMRNFEKDLGQRDFAAMMRVLERTKSTYKS